MKNKTTCLLFLSILSIFSINNVYGKIKENSSLTIRCIKSGKIKHDHKIKLCFQNKNMSFDDYVGDYNERYIGKESNDPNMTR